MKTIILFIILIFYWNHTDKKACEQKLHVPSEKLEERLHISFFFTDIGAPPTYEDDDNPKIIL